jgi:regulatory protein
MTDHGSTDNALETGVRALRRRDHSAQSLDARLERRGVDAAVRTVVVARLQELGYVDDVRFAHARAEALAERGASDRLIADDLERHGIAGELVLEAIAQVEPERARADAIVQARGASPRTARLLLSRGFSEEYVEGLVASAADDPIG